jgi:hypothetical protein
MMVLASRNPRQAPPSSVISSGIVSVEAFKNMVKADAAPDAGFRAAFGVRIVC